MRTADDASPRDRRGAASAHAERDRRVVVVGAGVVGLQIARLLAGRGVETALVDSRGLGAGASRAAVGVLSAPVKSLSAYSRLSRNGYARHATLARELRVETGVDVGHRECGSLRLRAEPTPKPERESAFWRAAGVRSRWVEVEDLDEWIPGYRGTYREALWLRREAVLLPSALLAALEASCRLRGVEIADRLGELRVELDDSAARPRLVDARGETPAAARGATDLVVAAGAWSERLVERLSGRPIEVVPVRGQAIEVDRPPPRCVVHFRPSTSERDHYLIPRDHGRTWIGSTLEEVGFDESTTPGGLDELLAAARAIWPDLRCDEVTDHWAGLRPMATRLGGPYLGPFPGVPGLWAATGCFKTGVLQSPEVARIVVGAILEGEPVEKDFRVDRP